MRTNVATILMLSILILTASASAETTTGAIDGVAVDADGRPLTGVVVTAGPPDQATVATTTSDVNGYFLLKDLPVGITSLHLEGTGGLRADLAQVTVQLGHTTSLGRIPVTLAPFELPDLTVVAAEVPLDTRSTAIGGNLLQDEFRDLPIDRNYRSLATLLPEVNVSFLGDEASFSGATGLDNRYFIDGMDVTDPYRGVTGTDLPYNFIAGVEVRSGGYEAEYRGSLGGTLNVVTLSGSDELHGSVFGFFANNRLTGEPRQGAIEPGKGDHRAYDGGFTLQGPLAVGKAWFAAAYNPSHTFEEVEILGTGLYDDVTDRQAFAGKVRWQASEDLQLQASIVGDPQTRDAVGETFFRPYFGVPLHFTNPDPYLATIKSGGVGSHLRADWYVGERSDLQLNVSYLHRRDRVHPATTRGRDEILYIDAVTATAEDGFPANVDATSDQTTVELRNRWYLGAHDLLVGAAYRDNQLDNDLTYADLTRYASDNYQQVTVNARGVVHNRIPSVYVQDSWHASERWRVNLGLRWDGQNLIDTQGKTAVKINDEYQPRIGVVFQPGEPGSQRIFASAGRFYQELSLYAASLALDPDATFTFVGYDHDPRVDPTGGFTLIGSLAPDIAADMKGQYYDEVSVGWERLLASGLTVGVRGVYRTLREAVEDGNVTGTDAFVWGNPGRGQLADYPRATRDYKAVVFTAGGTLAERLDLRFSYTLSRTEGNYPGLFNSDLSIPFPNYNASFDYRENTIKADGLLPSDRTHVVKLAGTWHSTWGLTAGTFVTVASGTPLSIQEGSSIGAPFFDFAQQRGTAGRLPTLWDLNLRFTYDLSRTFGTTWRPRLVADVFHLGSGRKPVNQDQVRNFNQDPDTGAQIDPNPTYGMATRYQPPTTVRLGVEVLF